MLRRAAPIAALAGLCLAAAVAPAAAAPQEYWDIYTFLEPYSGVSSDVRGDSTGGVIAGIRAGRVGWLCGWDADLAWGRADDPIDEHAADRYQVTLDGFVKLLESRHAAFIVLVGVGATRLDHAPDEDTDLLFHYRYGLGYRARFTERMGLRLDVTGLRSRAAGISAHEAALGWVIYF
jgi:hypothetical protein